MATTKPFAYNTGITISNTAQFGNIAIGRNGDYDFSKNPGSVQWWPSPDLELRHIIVIPDPTFSQPTPGAGLQFWGSRAFTESSFLDLANGIARMKGHSAFTGATDASNWLTLSGYPTTYLSNWLGSEMLYNSGSGVGNGDWVDANSNGIGDSWGSTYGTGTFSIVTGNGWTDNAQRLEVNTTYYHGLFQSLTRAGQFTQNYYYHVEFDIRSTIYCVCYVSGNQGFYGVGSTDGVVQHHSVNFLVTTIGGGYFMFYIPYTVADDIGKYIEVDNVTIKRQFSIFYGSELINNGGFDSGTGWTIEGSPGWIITGGTAYHSNEYNGVAIYSTLLGTVDAGSYYKIEFDTEPALPTGGTRCFLIIYNQSGSTIFGDIFRNTQYGRTSQVLLANVSSSIIKFNAYGISNNSNSFKLDNVSLKKVYNM